MLFKYPLTSFIADFVLFFLLFVLLLLFFFFVVVVNSSASVLTIEDRISRAPSSLTLVSTFASPTTFGERIDGEDDGVEEEVDADTVVAILMSFKPLRLEKLIFLSFAFPSIEDAKFTDDDDAREQKVENTILSPRANRSVACAQTDTHSLALRFFFSGDWLCKNIFVFFRKIRIQVAKKFPVFAKKRFASLLLLSPRSSILLLFSPILLYDEILIASIQSKAADEIKT